MLPALLFLKANFELVAVYYRRCMIFFDSWQKTFKYPRPIKGIKSGRIVALDIDLSKFFDRVDRNELMGKLALHIEDNAVLKLIGRCLQVGITTTVKPW